MRKITDEELMSFFMGLKDIIEAQKELNHIMAQRVTNLELKSKVEKMEDQFPKKAREFIQGGKDVV